MTALGQHQENRLSCSQCTDENNMVSQSFEQLKIVAMDESGSPLGLSTQSLLPLSKKDSFTPDGETNVILHAEEHVVVTINYQKQVTLSYSRSSISNDDYLNGKILQNLDGESFDLNNQDYISDTWISHWLSRPIAYLFLTDEAEAWLGDIRELRVKLLRQGYPIWHQRMMEILWVADLAYNSIAERISKLFS
jgi:hypothetical protein